VSSKFFWGLHEGVNSRNTLNRKYLLESIDPSLERFQLDHLDLIFCHRADPETPIEETVFAMHEIVASGKALYWGTSEWSADEIRAAWDVADRYGLHKPVMEQPEYNLFNRRKVEREYARLYEDIGLGTTTWSPLASGLLTGKYLDGVPEGSRAEVMDWLKDRLTDEEANARRCVSSRPSPTTSAAASRSCRSRGARRTRTSRPSSPARAASSRSTRTWPRSTSWTS
jgi:aryl-alcohol dehydrogenase-like predicted oxidoreductase